MDIDKDLHDALQQTVRAMAEYFYVEMGWEHFRAELLTEGEKANAHRDNARAIHAFLEAQKARHPELRALIEREAS